MASRQYETTASGNQSTRTPRLAQPAPRALSLDLLHQVNRISMIIHKRECIVELLQTEYTAFRDGCQDPSCTFLSAFSRLFSERGQAGRVCEDSWHCLIVSAVFMPPAFIESQSVWAAKARRRLDRGAHEGARGNSCVRARRHACPYGQ